MSRLGTSDGGVILSIPADTNLSTKQYFCVNVNTDGEAVLSSATTDEPIGVLENMPSAAGMAAEIKHSGLGKIKIGGTVAVGDKLGPDTDGMAIAVTANNKTYIAKALQAGVDGDIIEALIVPVSFVGA